MKAMTPTDTPRTDELIRSGPWCGPEEFVKHWDRAVDLCRELERALSAQPADSAVAFAKWIEREYPRADGYTRDLLLFAWHGAISELFSAKCSDPQVAGQPHETGSGNVSATPAVSEPDGGVELPAEPVLDTEHCVFKYRNEEYHEFGNAFVAYSNDLKTIIDRLTARVGEESSIVDRVWKALGIETYMQARPFTVWEHVERLKADKESAVRAAEEMRADAERYQELRAHWDEYTGLASRHPETWLDATTDAAIASRKGES